VLNGNVNATARTDIDEGLWKSQPSKIFVLLFYSVWGAYTPRPGRRERGRGNANTSSGTRAGPSVMRASRGVRRSNCKQIWLRVYDPSEGMLKLLLYKILLV
jgi:hypothetical protein